MDLNGGRLGFDHDGDHFIALAQTEAADPQPPGGGLGQPGAATRAKDRVGNRDCAGPPDANRGDRAPARSGQDACGGQGIFDF
jgi:hypothetical protein